MEKQHLSTQQPQKPKTRSRKKSSSKKTQSSTANKSIQKQNLVDKVRHKKLYKQSHNRAKQPNQNRLAAQVGKYEIDLQLVLGRGTFGQVYKANLIQRPEQVFACKLISHSRLQKQKVYQQQNSGTTTLIERLEKQIQTQKQISDCKYIVKLYDFIKVESEGYYLFMELCDIDLGKFIRQRNNHLPQNEALQFFRQLLKGYKHLFDRGICHRDLKPQNLLIQGDKNLKISDFGFVKVHNSNPDYLLKSAQRGQFLAESLVGSINYIAPDILIAQKQKNKYNPFKSDVWSMGIILYKMLYGKQPYQSQQTSKLLQKILKQPLHFPAQPKVSEQTKKLLQKMIEKDDNKRIDFKQLFQQCVGNQSNIKQQTQISSLGAQNQKERILIFYKMIMTKISYDSAHHATLRQIGIQQYQKYSNRLMTLIHEKRLQVLKHDKQKSIRQAIKKQIADYSQYFYKEIKESCSNSSWISPTSSTQLAQVLQNQLQIFKNKLAEYQQFQMLHQQVQYFLLLLLLLYNYEKGFVSIDYITTIIEKQSCKKLTLKKLQQLRTKNLNYK